MASNSCLTDRSALGVFHLLKHAAKQHYNANTNANTNTQEDTDIYERCKELFERDYRCIYVANNRGQLCGHYPAEIIIPVEQLVIDQPNVNQQNKHNRNDLTAEKLLDLISNARLARVRTRFACPSILCDGKYVCRSSTLSGGPEQYGRISLASLPMALAGAVNSVTGAAALMTSSVSYSSGSGATGNAKPPTATFISYSQNTLNATQPISSSQSSNIAVSSNTQSSCTTTGQSHSTTKELPTCTTGTSERQSVADPDEEMDKLDFWGFQDWNLVGRSRQHDIRLLKALGIKCIADLMLEKKKVKFNVYVTSSEKVDKEQRYQDFDILSIPYPGCEFFNIYAGNMYQDTELRYDWNHSDIDAVMDIPAFSPVCGVLDEQISWSEYRMWDLATLTKNYLRLLLAYLTICDTGMLVHCISGWDRTPLFVSLVRIALWADGRVHCSLSPLEMLYLTLGYDWYLFGHNLADRLTRGEEIMFFCFNFLKHLEDDSFSSVHQSPSAANTETVRARRIREMREIFMSAYGSAIGFKFGCTNAPTSKSFSGAIDSFARKIGLKKGNSTPV